MGHKPELDFVLSFCKEKKPGKGEDSYCYSFCDTGGMVAVFDGCGGAGAKTHALYSGHSEAYIASRLCAGAFYDGFRECFQGGDSTAEMITGVFTKWARDRLEAYKPPKGIVKGASVRVLPTTAAAAVVQQNPDGSALLSAIWAGDSRVFILDDSGLAQLTVDDTSVPDPMLNSYDDGVLRNVLCCNKEIQLHCTTIRVTRPFLIFAATDGCFGYVSTPMEFEAMILEALMGAGSVDQWEENLANAIGAVAGDDHTLCMAAYGYGSFEALQQRFAARCAYLREHYAKALRVIPVEDREGRFALWNGYKKDYMRYIEGGVGG